MKIGTMKFKKGEILTMSNFYPNYPDTRIEVREDIEVDVKKYNSYTSYFVSGKDISNGGEGRVNKCPYAHDIIKDEKFTPNNNFFTAFPYLKKRQKHERNDNIQTE